MGKSIGQKVYDEFMRGRSVDTLRMKYRRPIWKIEKFIRDRCKGIYPRKKRRGRK